MRDAEVRKRLAELPTAELKAVLTSPDYTPAAQAIARELLAQRVVEVPTHPCPSHPSSQVSGTCSRCGLFICAECDSALVRFGTGQCGACQQRAHAPGRGLSSHWVARGGAFFLALWALRLGMSGLVALSRSDLLGGGFSLGVAAVGGYLAVRIARAT